MSQEIIVVQVKTSYTKENGVYEISGVVEKEFVLGDDECIPQDVWINELLEYGYYYKA